ncbi:MAG: hypothetical protein M1829_004616 [Trizodia sp. TS-e1964]|nr:MAG: hypothetical protein M1829_004616 [Trizodia sp. TS-e1964]
MSAAPEPASSQSRLVLCFDGTGNKFQGTPSDTNIVKIYQMLDRNNPNQYHYYQPGIGTYVQNQASNSSTGSIFTRIKSYFSSAIDSAVGVTFVHHVLAGYQFVMRYYTPGDAIYIFGFSRGAYTARFLAEMLNTIGLLSKGNEELIPFAWDSFSDFQRSRGVDDAKETFMVKFKEAFCRPSVNVHFLGLFDCVNSVGQFELPLFRKSFAQIATPPATHIRHAISLHERRLKFKPALFLYDPEKHHDNDIKEVWFAGNHGDVGGGWAPEGPQEHLLSDTPLAWMVQEVMNLPNTKNQLSIDPSKLGPSKLREVKIERNQALGPMKHRLTNLEQRRLADQPHDMLAFGKGASFIGVLGWWILEVLPFFTRLELEAGKWVPRYWPPNLGSARDVPDSAVIHPTVQQMFKAGVLTADQMPKLGGHSPSIFLPANVLAIWARQQETAAKIAASVKSNVKSGAPKSGAQQLAGGKPDAAARNWNDMGSLTARSWGWD